MWRRWSCFTGLSVSWCEKARESFPSTSATIDFHKPGLGTVRATIRITEEEVEAVRSATADGDKHLPQWTLEILDEQHEVVATVLKTLYVRRKREN